MMLTYATFSEHLQTLTSHQKFCVAFSGGLDSQVLLHLLINYKKQNPNTRIRVVHVHHGLNKNANDWAIFCQKICENYEVDFILLKTVVKKLPQRSLEELARCERYTLLKNILESDEMLVTAHHQNDQAETLLLQLFRGAGPKGLSSMPGKIEFGKSELLRPLLIFSRESLMEYAENNNLSWITDDSNHNLLFDRNFIRHELLPLIKKRWLNITENLARSALHCSEANRFIEENIQIFFDQAFDKSTHSLSISRLLKLDEITQRYVIRYWLTHLKFSLPSSVKLRELQKSVLHSRSDSQAYMQWKNVEIRRYGNKIFVMKKLKKHDPSLIISWDLKGDLHLPNDLGIISIRQLEHHNLLDLENVTIRFRRGGEACRIKNRQCTHSLKKLFQEWRIPPWYRDRIPLVYSHDQLKLIVGYAACE